MKSKIIIAILILISCILFFLSGMYMYLTGATSNNTDPIEVEIPSGATVKEIGKILKDNNLIHNDTFFYYYVKLFSSNSIKASVYELNEAMGLAKIVEILEEGNEYNKNSITITFKEGINMVKLANAISENTSITKELFLEKMKDRTFITPLIEKYWFLTDDILNENIYYPLEGYLFPNTYQFRSKDVEVLEIVEKLLDETNKVLTTYKDKLDNHDLSVHEVLTLASVVELEGTTDEFRSGIASVFYNRLNLNMSLGSDVTTYYALQVDMSERDLTSIEFNTYNPYNTRGPQMSGKLPIGPVCNPSKGSILATIDQEESDYLYFVADKNRVVYFTKTLREHNAKIKEFKDKGDWITW